MSDNLQVLSAIIKLVADAANDTENLLGSGKGGIHKFTAYSNLIGDFLALVPQLGDLPDEVQHLTPEAVATLVDDLVAHLNITNAHAKKIVDASAATLHSIATHLVANLEALAAAIKDPDATQVVLSPSSDVETAVQPIDAVAVEVEPPAAEASTETAGDAPDAANVEVAHVAEATADAAQVTGEAPIEPPAVAPVVQADAVDDAPHPDFPNR